MIFDSFLDDLSVILFMHSFSDATNQNFQKENKKTDDFEPYITKELNILN